MMAVIQAAEAATPKTCPSCGTRYPADALFCSLDGAPLTTSPGAIAAAAATDPSVGREILGHIEIRQLVGIGAMGRVYRAFQKGIDRDVAVKILHRELSANHMLVARFHREAKVASRLAHPNVVHVLLTGQLPDGALYIVMEYLDGLSLQSAVAAVGGAMPLPRALHIALQLCDAAGEAHVQGVVHRDLKPENVMLVKRADDPDYVKVLDFGIARLNWGEQSMATAAGLIFGTARYISPEGALGDKVSPQGDVYSIATMVYQMLSGRTPFDGDQAVALLVQQIHDLPPPLRSIPRAAYVPEPIAAVVMQNLAKKAEDRADNARAFGRALLEAAVLSGLSAQDLLTRPAMLGPGRGAHTGVVQMPSMQRTHKLQLEPDVAARISTAKTAYEPPADGATERVPQKTEVPEPAMVAPLASPSPPAVTAHSATTRWIPPSDFATRLVPTPPPSSVDSTMDDQQLPVSARPAPSSRTVDERALPLAAAPAPASTPLPIGAVLSPEEAAPVPSRTGATTPPRRVGDVVSAPSSRPGSSTPAPTTKPPSSVESTLAGEEAPFHLPRTQGRAIGVVVACFLVGALGMGVFAYRAGLIGGHGRDSAAGDYAALAGDALARHQWESVRDLTDKGLARAPADPQLLGLRARASVEALASARIRVASGDTAAGVRLATLASQLDANDADASALLATLAEPPAPPPVEPSIPALAATVHAAGGAAASPVRAMVDVSSARPGVGQPVDLAGRIQGSARAKVEGARFHMAGPGIPTGTQLDGTDDGSGVFRATFAFLQAGRFEVSFTARADGVAVRAAHVILVGDVGPGPAQAGPSAAAPPLPAPTDSAKWL
jgi:serine/threonine protein kinase